MTENERKIKRRVQGIAAGGMFVFFCLLLVLVVQLVIMGNQRSMQRSLENRQAQLVAQIQSEERNLRYYTSDAFIEEWLLRELGYGRDGAQIFG